jgi:hypothetical protein
MEVRKMKNGRQNIAMDFFMEEYSFTAFRKVEKDGVETLEQMKVDTLTVRWDGELHPTEEKRNEDDVSPAQHKMLTALKELVSVHGVDCAECPRGQRGVPSKSWEDKCIADKICASVNVFRKQKSSLKDQRIGVSASGDLVWFLIG